MIPLRVGICIVDYTRNKLQLPHLLEKLCDDGSMEFIVMDMNKSLTEQGPFDVIIQKVLEWYNVGEEQGNAKLRKLVSYVRSHQSIKMLDPIEETVRLADRFYSMEVMRDCQFTMKGIQVFVPKYIFLDDSNVKNALDVIAAGGIKFPIITKPPVTRCDAEAHDMSIIFSERRACDIVAPCVIQEFVNHGSMLYKVAAVGDKMYICERPSVKNLVGGIEPTVYFDSMTVSKRDIHNEDLHEQNPQTMKFRTTAGSCKHLLDSEIVTELLRHISNRVNLNLFGIDIIIEERTGNYGIIDLNYLPSYDGVLEYFAADLYSKLKVIDKERLFKCNSQNGTIHSTNNGISELTSDIKTVL